MPLNLFPWRRSKRQSKRHSARLQDRTPYVVLSIGAVLFSSALAFLLWPGASDGFIGASRFGGNFQSTANDSAVAGKGNKESKVGNTANADQVAIWRAPGSAKTQAAQNPTAQSGHTAITSPSAQQCTARRTVLQRDSDRVDRFDPLAIADLNAQIASYNKDCAKQATSQPGGTSKANSRAAVTPASKATQTEPQDKQPNTKASQAAATVAAAPSNGWSPTVMTVQSLLGKLGYEPGPVDGFMGSRTRSAVQAFQTDHGLPVDGTVNIALLEQILKVKSPVASKADHPAPAKAASRQSAPTRAPVAPKAVVRAAPPAAKSAEPDQTIKLAQLTSFERQTIEWACANTRNVSADPTDYDRCVDTQLVDLAAATKPDLQRLNTFEREAVQRLCAGERYQKGLAAYYECVNRHQISLNSVRSKPNIDSLAPAVRQAVKSHCDGLQFTESLPVYYRCVDSQITQARR